MDKILKNIQKKYGNFEKSARLKQVILALGIKQVVFSKKIGVSRTMVTQMLSADRDINESIAFKIERNFPIVNAEWLISGEGEMMKNMVPVSDIVSEPMEAYKKEIDRLRDELERERAEKMTLMEVVKNLSKK